MSVVGGFAVDMIVTVFVGVLWVYGGVETGGGGGGGPMMTVRVAVTIVGIEVGGGGGKPTTVRDTVMIPCGSGSLFRGASVGSASLASTITVRGLQSACPG